MKSTLETTKFCAGNYRISRAGNYRISSFRAGDRGTPLRQNCLEVGATACAKRADAVENADGIVIAGAAGPAPGKIVAFESRLSVLALTKISEC